MPRRPEPDRLAAALGARLRQLRTERGLTAEELVYGSEVGSKGYLSDIEAGRALPSLKILKRLADYLGVALLDLVTFANEDPRQKYVDLTRSFAPGTIRKLLKEADVATRESPTKLAANAEQTRRRLRPRSR